MLFKVPHHLLVVSKVNTRTLKVGGAGELPSKLNSGFIPLLEAACPAINGWVAFLHHEPVA